MNKAEKFIDMLLLVIKKSALVYMIAFGFAVGWTTAVSPQLPAMVATSQTISSTVDIWFITFLLVILLTGFAWFVIFLASILFTAFFCSFIEIAKNSNILETKKDATPNSNQDI